MGNLSKSLRRGQRSLVHVELMECRTLLSGYTASLVAPVPTRTNTDFNAASSTLVRNTTTGTLYGFDTAGGTNGTGTIYEVDPTTKALTVIDALGPDGPEDPIQLLIDSSGDIFGITQYSGTNGATTGPELFELPAGNLGTPTDCYTFPAAEFSGGAVGTQPLAMVIDSSNNIYVLNSFGGTNNGGTVDEFSASSSYQTPDVLGSLPEDYHAAASAITLGQNGTIFGTTAYGGTNSLGSLWELTPGESIASTVASFDSTTGSPTANDVMYVDAENDVFGTAGTATAGIWEYTTSTQSLAIIASLSTNNTSSGYNPSGGVIADSAGDLFGTTAQGDTNGTFFEMNASTHAITYTDVSSTATGNEPFSTPVADGSGDFYIVNTYGAANNAGAVVELTPGGTGGGGGGGGTTGTAALSPSITRSTVASTVVGETKLKAATVTIDVTNDGSAILKGTDTVELFASQDGVVDSSSIQVGTMVRSPVPRPGKSVVAHITVPSLNISAGSYTLIPEVINTVAGITAAATTGTSVTVNAPFTDVTGVISAVTPDIVKSVGTFKLTLENSGNIEATGKATIIYGISVDGVTLSIATTPTINRPVNVLVGRPTVIVLHVKVPKGFAAGTYYPFVSYMQGTTSFAMAGTAAFTVK